MKSGWFCATHQKRGQPLIPLQSCAAAPNEIEKTKTAAAAKLASPTSGLLQFASARSYRTCNCL